TAIDYLDALGMDRISAYETELLNYATQALKEVPGIRIIGESTHKAALISFILDSIHPHDIGSLLDRAGIATRAGHHCAMPVMNFFKVPATTRVSFSFYNTHAEIDAFIRALYAVKELFHG
ncbi:MAG: aminotransferase class V-fold PLP-dependent enzyme, partial [Gammaproteobacteria bacterium]|nr:aminotransferase class V-fold PLP-dependent enzyme [Gammaproteobacteria bacterium]